MPTKVNIVKVLVFLRLPWWLSGKEHTCNVGNAGSIPGSGRFPGEGNGNLLQYSCLENSRDRGAWWAAVYGVAQSRTRLKQLSSLEARFPYHDSRAMTRSPSPLAWRPDTPDTPREAH